MESMKIEKKTHLKNWLIVIGIIAAILAVCLIQIHHIIPLLTNRVEG